jgi:DNA (cytosine-5)-methyltransferase 1
VNTRRDTPTAIDLFSGAGGFSLGFHAAGCRLLSAYDHDVVSRRTYRNNFERLQPDSPPYVPRDDEDSDLERVSPAQIATHGEPDIVLASPPCQGFSTIGRAKLNHLPGVGFADDPRNELYGRVISVVEKLRPQAVVLENVPGMRTVRGRNFADEAAEALTGAYHVGHAILNAAHYGVPQYRARLFIIALRKDLQLDQPRLPAITHGDATLPARHAPGTRDAPLPFEKPLRFQLALPLTPESGGLPVNTVSAALKDLPVLSAHMNSEGGSVREVNRDVELPYGGPPTSDYARLMRDWPGLGDLSGVTLHYLRRNPRDHETFQAMKSGDLYPAALAIAIQRFESALSALPEPPDRESEAFEEMRKRYVPPYPDNKFKDKWRKLHPDRPSHTLPAHLAKDGYSHIHHDGNQGRTITVREAARLQSFPDAYAFSGSMGQRFRQIGNAVPPLLAWAIAEPLLSQLGFASRPVPQL